MAPSLRYGADEFGRGELNELVDPDALLGAIGLDDPAIERRKAFVGFNDADADRLRGLQPAFADHAERLADEFYRNLERHEETREILERSPKSVDELKRTQAAYFETLATGSYDRAYFRDRARIGKLHELLEMPLEFYLGQYVIYFERILDLVADRLATGLLEQLRSEEIAGPVGLSGAIGEKVEMTMREFLAVLRLITLDIQVVTDTYLAAHHESITNELERQRAIRREVEGVIEDSGRTAASVAESSARLEDLAREQAGAVTSVASDLETVTSVIERITETAGAVAEDSVRAEGIAAEGRAAADEAIEVMRSIEEATAAVVDRVRRLEQRTDEIDGIVEVIDDIAGRTDLLALNASIEAARAGEAGEGFAVVAEEVQSLAEASRSHAADIEAAIESIDRDVVEAVGSLERATERVDTGVSRVMKAAEKLSAIDESIEAASEGMREVSAATDDHSAATKAIAGKVEDLVEHAEAVASEVEAIASANDAQASKVRRVTEAVRRLAAETGPTEIGAADETKNANENVDEAETGSEDDNEDAIEAPTGDDPLPEQDGEAEE